MSLPELREQIDAIDREWIQLFKRRLDVAKQIALVKKRKGLSIPDAERERVMMERNLRQAQELQINPRMVEEVFRLVLVYTKQEMGRVTSQASFLS